MSTLDHVHSRQVSLYFALNWQLYGWNYGGPGLEIDEHVRVLIYKNNKIWLPGQRTAAFSRINLFLQRRTDGTFLVSSSVSGCKSHPQVNWGVSFRFRDFSTDVKLTGVPSCHFAPRCCLLNLESRLSYQPASWLFYTWSAMIERVRREHWEEKASMNREDIKIKRGAMV